MMMMLLAFTKGTLGSGVFIHHLKTSQLIMKEAVRQETDGFQNRHLQLVSYLYFLREEIGTTSLLFILPEAEDRWAPE